MIRWLLLPLALLPLPGWAATRALFVGIDRYQFSKTNDPNADFKDLSGAVGDTNRVKEALRTAYGLDLDRTATGCRSANAISTTLTNACATRLAIFAAYDDLVKRSASGDTLIFYFAGHGSQFAEDQGDQASGYSDTILAYDARDPAHPMRGDILDREIRDRIDMASAKGVNVVTIFDSCNSGTATRDDPGDGESRSVPNLRVPSGTRPRQATPWWSGGGKGYRVHLAAAADGEEAREVGAVGARAGVFSTALAATLIAMPTATFDDIMVETARLVDGSGHSRQQPQAEGTLNKTLVNGGTNVVLYAASPSPPGVMLAAGRLSGVTQGSTFALFANSTQAIAPDATPLATAVVSSVDASTATLTVSDPPAAPLPARLVARKLRHAFGETDLRIRNTVPTTSGGAAVDTALKGLAAPVRLADPPQLIVSPEGGGVALKTADAVPVAPLGDPRDPRFADTLADAVQKYAHVKALIDLRSDPAHADASFCIANDLDYDVLSCPPLPPRAVRTLTLNARAKLALVNVNAAKLPRYLYLFGIDEAYGVTLLLPANNGKDPEIGYRQPVQRVIAPNTPGRYRFVTIATDARINAAALEQDRAGARDPVGCTTALEQLLCAAATGSRDPSVPRVGAWTATVTEVIVK